MLLRYCFDIVIISRVDIVDNRLISRFKWCRCVNVELTLLNRSLFDLIIYIYIIYSTYKKDLLNWACNVDTSSIREIFRCWVDIEAMLCLDIPKQCRHKLDSRNISMLNRHWCRLLRQFWNLLPRCLSVKLLLATVHYKKTSIQANLYSKLTHFLKCLQKYIFFSSKIVLKSWKLFGEFS